MDRFGSSGMGGEIQSPMAASPLAARITWIVIRVLAAVVTVPIAEELAFRGFLMRRLVCAEFESVPLRRVSWFPILISSLGFGLLHGERWLAGSIAGIFYALISIRHGNLRDAVVAHATTNALLAGYVITFHQWQLW
jgi:CAAX prenyl protease-like protein